MNSDLPDHSLLSLSVISSLTVYFGVSLLVPNSQLPLLASVFVFTNMISRTALVQGWLSRTLRQALASRNAWRLQSTSSSDYASLGEVSKIELVEALQSLTDYSKNSRVSNERRKKLFKMLSWRQQKLCDAAGYSRKLKSIETHIDRNQTFFDAVIDSAKLRYAVSYKDFEAAKKNLSSSQNTSSSNYRVVESLSHFIRDWSTTDEISPMLHYIKDQLELIIPLEEAEKTCVVVPGSGLGRVAHEIALHRSYGAVHAVEFSGLMHLCNEFIYDSDKSHTIYPHVHTTSNFVDLKSQFREILVPGDIERPSNLTLHLDDFRYFSIPNKERYENIVVVSAFFLDTAENIMDYFDQIDQLVYPSRQGSVKKGFWINYGPLKYGSAAQAELNATEIQHIRAAMGWKDLHYNNTITNSEDQIYGYITDKHSMWQGYYGISQWTSAHKNSQSG